MNENEASDDTEAGRPRGTSLWTLVGGLLALGVAVAIFVNIPFVSDWYADRHTKANQERLRDAGFARVDIPKSFPKDGKKFQVGDKTCYFDTHVFSADVVCKEGDRWVEFK